MNETLLSVLFESFIAMAVIWGVLILWLFRRLRKRHTSTYEAIGSPGIFSKNKMRSNLLFWKFLFSTQWRELGDSSVAIVCWIMRILVVIYLILFISLVALTV